MQGLSQWKISGKTRGCTGESMLMREALQGKRPSLDTDSQYFFPGNSHTRLRSEVSITEAEDSETEVLQRSDAYSAFTPRPPSPKLNL